MDAHLDKIGRPPREPRSSPICPRAVHHCQRAGQNPVLHGRPNWTKKQHTDLSTAPALVFVRPYFVDARPYIIPSGPYIVPSMPYIVAKCIRQHSESIAVRAPKTSIKLRKPIKTPAGHFSVSFEGQSSPRAVPHTDVVPASTGNAVIFSVETSPSSPSRLKTSENGSCYVIHICANAKLRRLLVVVRRRLGRHGFQSEVQCVARKAANVRVRR